jgi:uncharacterized protein YfiM (DUF2279 family)
MRPILFAALMAAGPALAGPCTAHDKWTGPDKVKHVGAGAAVASAVVLATGSRQDAIFAAIAIGVIKEMADRKSAAHTCSLQDLAATVTGGVAGAYGTSWVVGPNYIGFIKRF